MVSGKQGKYYWIVWNAQSLDDVLTTFPEIVHTNYVVITAFDSGPLVLSNAERQGGWAAYGDVAHSPQVTSRLILPYDHYDEWYVFKHPTVVQAAEVFVNYTGFRLQSDNNQGSSESSDAMNDLQRRFWQQLQHINPESYVAAGDNLIFVTQNQQLFAHVQRWNLPKVERR